MNQTHPNFKSYVAGINNAIDMDYKMWSPLARQIYVRKRTTPHESLYWNDDALQNFTLRIEDIDRLYLFDVKTFRFGKVYEIVARLSSPLCIYVQLYVQHYTHSVIRHMKIKKFNGLMYISEDPNLFIKVIRQDERNTKYSLKRIMYTSLKNDSIHLADEEEEETASDYDDDDKILHKPSKLCNMCYNVIYQNNDILEEIYINQLPIVLKQYIRKYIETKDAMIDYNDYLC